MAAQSQQQGSNPPCSRAAHHWNMHHRQGARALLPCRCSSILLTYLLTACDPLLVATKACCCRCFINAHQPLMLLSLLLGACILCCRMSGAWMTQQRCNAPHSTAVLHAPPQGKGQCAAGSAQWCAAAAQSQHQQATSMTAAAVAQQAFVAAAATAAAKRGEYWRVGVGAGGSKACLVTGMHSHVRSAFESGCPGVWGV